MEVNESKKLFQFKKKFYQISKTHPLFENVTKTNGNIVFGRGSDEPKIVFIGEAPGQSENKVGKPFVGRSGKMLDKWIKYLNLNQNDFCIINVVPIIPLNKENKIRPPTENEINYFLPTIEKYLELLNPKLIVLLGRSAASIFDKTLKPSQTKKWKNKELFFIYHPSYYLRNGGKGFEESLEKLKLILEDETNQLNLKNFE